jgi:hypothetical protein
LLALCRLQAQDWVATERKAHEDLQHECEPETLACALAERAALGGIPVGGAFWTETLLEHLEHARHLVDLVRYHLGRLFEAPHERRLFLLDRIAAQQWGIA